ncbi:nectin-4-like isoform X1 [Branchiostoma lanceolatum]|uniref:nectin-4-like isoform X1 n=1 Tax=Branchiostoma lanceolatum TaxID=7740 RepID=UPI0034546411
MDKVAAFLVAVITFICAEGATVKPSTPTIVTVRGMEGDSVTLPAYYRKDYRLFALTWNKLSGGMYGTRRAVYMFSPSTNSTMSFGTLKNRAFLTKDRSLTIVNAGTKDEGLYVLTSLLDVIGQEEHYVLLEMHAPPQVQIGVPSPLQIVEATSLTLNCTVDQPGALILPLFWRKEDVIVDTFHVVSEQESNQSYMSTLFLASVSRAQSGNYSCVAKHIGGEETDSVFLEVTYPAKIINISEANVVMQGEDVILRCLAEGNPVPSLSWLRTGDPDPLSSIVLPVYTGTRTLKMARSKANGSGEYTCVAANGVGKPHHESVLVSLSVVNAVTKLESKTDVGLGLMSGSKLYTILVIAGSVAAAICLLVVLLLLAFLLCRRGKTSSRRHSDVQMNNMATATHNGRVNGDKPDVRPHRTSSDKGTPAAERRFAKVSTPYESDQCGFLTLQVNDIVEVLRTDNSGWWYGYHRGKLGAFPAACVEMLTLAKSSSQKKLSASSETNLISEKRTVTS